MKQAIQRGIRARAGHDPRAAALRALDMVLGGNLPSQAALDTILRDARLPPSDAALCTELVYGVLRQKLWLERALGRFLKRPEKLPAECLLVLTLAAYELAFLDRVPGYATVNWAVSRVRNRFGSGLAGVANASLRAFQREQDTVHQPEPRPECRLDEAKAVSCRAISYSLPAWILERWRRAYGPEAAAAYAEASLRRPVAGIRVNLSREDGPALRERLLREHNGIAIGRSGAAFPGGLPYEVKNLEREGRVSRQSPAVMEALETLEALERPGAPRGPVWDACAGRGGKSLALLERGLDIRAASDTSFARLAAMRGELSRLGFASGWCSGATDHPEGGKSPKPPMLALADAATPPFAGPFAAIVLDVPCSGLGTLCRRPEIRLRRREADIAAYAAAQDGMLAAAARLLAEGGVIIYLTCTLLPEENEDRAAAFLAGHPDFILESERTTPPDSPWNEFLYRAVLRRKTTAG